MRKLRTRTLAGAAVAVFAAATAFAVTNAADATTAVTTAGVTVTAARAGSTLSAAAGRSTIPAGQRDTVSGTLLADGKPAAGRLVGLYRYADRAHRWRLIRVKLTGKAGAVKYTVRPETTGKYRIVYRGNPSLGASTSGTVTITVESSGTRRAAALSISAAPASIAPRRSTTITGTLTGAGRPLPHRIVALYRYDAATRKWVRVGVELTGPRGQVRFVRAPSATSAFELMYGGAPTLSAAHSGQATVTVG